MVFEEPQDLSGKKRGDQGDNTKRLVRTSSATHPKAACKRPHQTLRRAGLKASASRSRANTRFLSEPCSSGVHSQSKAAGSARLRERRGTQHGVGSEGSVPLHTAQPQLSKLFFTFLPFLLDFDFLLPPTFPYRFQLPFGELQIQGNGIWDRFCFFLIRSRQTWSLLPRSPASCACSSMPESLFLRNRAGKTAVVLHDLRCLLAVPGMILKASYETHVCPCALQGITATMRVRWLMLPLSC